MDINVIRGAKGLRGRVFPVDQLRSQDFCRGIAQYKRALEITRNGLKGRSYTGAL